MKRFQQRNLHKLVVATLFLTLVLAACTREARLNSYLQENRIWLNLPASDDERPVRFEVAPGIPARTIAEQLAAARLIRDAQLFEAYVRASGVAHRLEAGTYILHARMTPVQIAEILQNSQAAEIRITIPEGWRLEQIADSLDAGGLLDGQEYRRRVENVDLRGLETERWPFLNTRPAGTSLEGYLFPDTYHLPLDGPLAAALISRQLDAFASRILPLYQQAAAADSTIPDLYSALVLASIVEREAVIAAERPVIAGVYLNRLTIGMNLEADPTVQYAMGYQQESGQWWKTPVFLEEYEHVDSPYNTYRYPGIPPGPIANPGVDSFQAVLYPTQHDYLYFVASADKNGSHVFAQTYAEHLENVRRYYTNGQ